MMGDCWRTFCCCAWNNRSGELPTMSPKRFSRAVVAGKRAIKTSAKRRTTMRTESYSEGQAMKRAKIMVVDDDADLRQALSLRLRANHFETLNVCDGHSAIAMAQEERPHLISLDLCLPAGG